MVVHVLFSSSGGKTTDVIVCWESADDRVAYILYKTKISEHYRGVNPTRQIAICVYLVQPKFDMLKVVLERVFKDMTCADNVPWFGGVCPTPIINLDDAKALKTQGIVLQTGDHQKKGDYYMLIFGRRWFVVERKDRPSKFEKVVAQITDTVVQLRMQNKPVDGVVVVAEGINFRERGVYDIDHRNNNEVYYKLSQNRNRVIVEGMTLRFYTTREVDAMRRR